MHNMRSEVYNIDVMQYIKDVPDKYFGLCIADPPFAVKYARGKNGFGVMTKNLPTPQDLKWDSKIPDKEFFDELLRASDRVIIWGGQYFTHLLPQSKCWLVWDKCNGIENKSPFADCELAWTNMTKVVKQFHLRQLGFMSETKDGKRIHQTQKPIELYEWLIRNYAKDGDTIFDPMAGSFSSRIAAYRLGYDYVGCEIDENFFNKAQERFKQETSQLSLFKQYNMLELNKIYNEDCLDGLKKLPDNSIDCCVTSPPYYALRDYGVDGQIGLEETPEQYIRKLTEVFVEVYRVLKPEGTLWLNIGDSYNGSGGCHKKDGKNDTGFQGKNDYLRGGKPISVDNLKPKDLIGIPWMLAFSLRNAGWYLRQDIIWHKPNPMPESVTDRCTKSHEYIFLLSKSQKYYFDYEAISEPCANQNRTNYQSGSRSNGENKDRNDNDLGERSKLWKPRTKNCQYDGQQPNSMHLRREQGLPDKEYVVRNKRDVWSVNVKPDSVAHFATYPEELIAPCILAGCPNGGVVLDPFMGSGTTARVARKLNRHFVGFELNPEYCKIINKKIQVSGDLFY